METGLGGEAVQEEAEGDEEREGEGEGEAVLGEGGGWVGCGGGGGRVGGEGFAGDGVRGWGRVAAVWERPGGKGEDGRGGIDVVPLAVGVDLPDSQPTISLHKTKNA